MKDTPEFNNLLSDVLSEGSPPDLQGGLLGETLRLARRRRQFRRARGVSAAVAVAGVSAFFAYRSLTMRDHTQPNPLESYALVRTQPLMDSRLVLTRTLDPRRTVFSEAFTAVVQSSHEAFRIIGDRELLALASPNAALLIRSGANSEELKFVSPDVGEAGSAD